MLSDDMISLFVAITRGDTERVESLTRSGAINGEKLLTAAYVNRIPGFISSRINELSIQSLFDEKLVASLNKFYLSQIGSTYRLMKETEAVADSFADENIPVVFLKGPLFSLQYYGSILKMASSDIDLLVTKEPYHGRAEHVLQEQGYTRKSIVLLSNRLQKFFTHHTTFRKGSILLDLHWVLRAHWSYRIDYDRLWSNRKSVEFQGKSYTILDHEYDIVFRVLSIFQDIQTKRLDFKSVVDLYMVLRVVDSFFEWADFFDRRKEERILAICINVLNILLKIFRESEELSGVARFIRKNDRLLSDLKPDDIFVAQGEPAIALPQKSWAFSLYESPRRSALLWWALSLPFRLCEYPDSVRIPVQRMIPRYASRA